MESKIKIEIYLPYIEIKLSIIKSASSFKKAKTKSHAINTI